VFTRLDNGLAVLLLRDGLPSGATPEAGDTVRVRTEALVERRSRAAWVRMQTRRRGQSLANSSCGSFF